MHVGQFDLASVFRARRLRRAPFLAWVRDTHFANVVARWDTGERLFGGSRYFTEPQRIDPASPRPRPAEPGAVAILAEADGESRGLMPRQVLRRQLDRAAAMGYRVRGAFEFELILLAETAESIRARGFADPAMVAPDNRCGSGTTAATHAALIAGLEAEILGFGVSLFGLGVELGSGCLEATLGAVEGLRPADNAAFFRLAARAYCRRNGLTASFMPCLGPGFPAIGGHLALSLADAATGANLFASADGETGALARRFIASMMEIVPGCFALCTSTVNAYRRLVPDSWAPKAVTWADFTFTTAVRSVPSAGDGARLEFRAPPADCNPYLTMALMLGAGLDGIERGLAAPPPPPPRGRTTSPRARSGCREALPRRPTAWRRARTPGGCSVWTSPRTSSPPAGPRRRASGPR